MQKVLMIDNAKLMHSVIKARLAEDELEFHSAYSGEEGIETARKILPDVILLDIEMPAPDGFEVCRQLKADYHTSTIPIIFLSGLTSIEEKVKGLNLGAVDYVTKPFEAPELQARVRACLRTKELVDILERRAMIDGLTAVWNRAYFNQRFAAEVSAAKRSGRALSCIVADVDHFKSINDTHGHGFGDVVLRGVAQIFQEQARAEDIICRYGGEEFVILTPGVDMAGAAALAERIRTIIADRTFTRGGISQKVTCSFGINDTSTSIDNLIEFADKALYRAKQSGRNRVEIYNPDPKLQPAQSAA